MTAPLLDMGCQDVQKVVHPYLDGEFEQADAALLERHLLLCAACREMVAFERAFKANLRARLRRPPAPPELRARIAAALDRADARGEGPLPGVARRAAPWLGAAVAAAAVALLVGAMLRPRAQPRPPNLTHDAVRAHEKNLPVEVSGNAQQVRHWMAGKVPVPVRPPRLGNGQAALVGGRVGHLSDRDAAQLTYRVGQSNVTLYVFDASGMPLSGPTKRRVGTREVFVDHARGYNVVFYRDRDVGYAFTSDLDEDEMLRLLSASLDQAFDE